VNVDFGTVQQITITLQGPAPTDLVKSTVIYNETTKVVQVLSVTSVTTPVTGLTTQQLFDTITSPSFPVITLPSVVIAAQITTDTQLQTVVSQIQQLSASFIDVLPTTTQIQTISPTVTQYIAVIGTTVPQQVVVLFDNSTNTTSVVSSTPVDTTVTPYFLT